MSNDEDKDQLIAKLKQTIISLIGWTYGGECSDCEMFRVAPSAIVFQHAYDCGYLETINKALILLGRPQEEGHHYQDPKAEMQRLAQERLESYNNSKRDNK